MGNTLLVDLGASAQKYEDALARAEAATKRHSALVKAEAEAMAAAEKSLAEAVSKVESGTASAAEKARVLRAARAEATAAAKAQAEAERLVEQAHARQAQGVNALRDAFVGALGPVGSLGQTFAAGGVLAVGAMAVTKLFDGLGTAMRTGLAEVQEWEAASAKLTAVFQGNATAIERTLGLVDRLNKSQPFFEDDQIANAAATLKLFDLTDDQIEKLLPQLTDMASVMGTDVAAAAQKVGVAMAGNTRGLKEWGIVVKEGADQQTILNAILEKSAIFGDAAAQKALGLSGALAQAGKDSKDLGAALAEKVTPAITAAAAAWGTLARGITDFIAEPKELEIKVKVSGLPGVGGEGGNDPMAGILNPTAFAEQMFGSTSAPVTYGAGRLREWTADQLGAMPDESKALDQARAERRKKVEVAAKKQAEEDAKLPARIAAAAQNSRNALTRILEGQMQGDLRKNATFGGGIAGEQSIVAKFLGMDVMAFVPELKAKLEGLRDDLADKAKVKARESERELDRLEREGREREEQNRLSFEQGITKIYNDRRTRDQQFEDSAFKQRVEREREIGRLRQDLIRQAVESGGQAVATSIRGDATQADNIRTFAPLAGAVAGGVNVNSRGVSVSKQGAELGMMAGGIFGAIAGSLLDRVANVQNAKLAQEERVRQAQEQAAMQLEQAAKAQIDAAKQQQQAVDAMKISFGQSVVDFQAQGKAASIRRGIRAGTISRAEGEAEITRIQQGAALEGAVSGLANTFAGAMNIPNDPRAREAFRKDALALAERFKGGATFEDVRAERPLDNVDYLRAIAEAVKANKEITADLLDQISKQGTEAQPIVIKPPRNERLGWVPDSAWFRATGAGTSQAQGTHLQQGRRSGRGTAG